MKDSYNFNKNLKMIVAPCLEDIGFKKKNAEFIRIKNNYIEKIYFQRSRFNTPNHPFEFYLNLYLCTSEDSVLDIHRLDRPTDIPLPDYYRSYGLDIMNGKEVDFDQFSKQQKQIIGNYMLSRMWRYSSENELKNLFYEAKDLIVSKGCIYFETMKSLLNEGDIKKVIEFKFNVDYS